MLGRGRTATRQSLEAASDPLRVCNSFSGSEINVLSDLKCSFTFQESLHIKCNHIVAASFTVIDYISLYQKAGLMTGTGD